MNRVRRTGKAEIVQIIGARPNFPKVAPINRRLACSATLRPLLVHTGQHYDFEMSEVFMRDLQLPKPDIELGVGSASHAVQTAEIMIRLEPYLERLRPACVMVVGDVNSTIAAALTAVKLGIPVAHVEAGLRSFNWDMPEEINRLTTDAISELLFAPSADAVDNLRREGATENRIHLVGNVMIDSLEAILPRAKASDVLRRLGLSQRRYLLATLHRPSNVDADGDLETAVKILEACNARLPTVLVAHPRTRKRLEATSQLEALNAAGIRVLDPLGYVEFLALEAGAAGVITDSGGVQEETTVLGVPCITLRTETERLITVTEGTNAVTGLDKGRVMEIVDRIAAGHAIEPRRPALWDGHAAERIVEVLEARFA